MAGTITNLPLSQQFDGVTGNFLAGGRLYFFAANTTTPQNAYKDTALTIPHPNPIELDSAGRVPMFYLADGSIRVRLVNKSGVVQFEEQNLLVIGPSSGGGGGGAAVDASSIFQTGDCIWLDVAGTRAGWVRDNGRTIGSATSGASERANADCEPLYTFLWQTYSDTICPVSTGRGASATADWSANKFITLPDKRGRSPFGADAMGNSSSSRFLGVPSIIGDYDAPGSIIGEALHGLSEIELPSVSHEVSLLAAGSAVFTWQDGQGGSGSGSFIRTPAASGLPLVIDTQFTNPRYTFAFGSGSNHNNTPLGIIGTFYRKL